MQFNSVDFLIFFPAVIAVYFVIPAKIRMYWLLAASYYFYMSWNAKYAVLIGGSTVVTYLSALLFVKLNGTKTAETKKKAVMVLCIIINLGILALFKYGNFAIESLNKVLGILHIGVVERRFDFLLPVGISFYTFQALGYMIDVYRGDVEAEKNFFRYALFVSFFPQLVAGPIERSKNLLGQMRDIEKKKLWDLNAISSGAILMVWGLFMKMVIADRASILVDTVFDNYRMYGSTELITAIVFFALQIYCDFASYSTIATGAARIMGFSLMENFNAPYLATSIRDFWSRWHISLSTWFRDYLYIPLGGNRKGRLRKALNTMIVFLVSGLWHGANWTFVFWGGLHGLYQVIGDLTKEIRGRIAARLNVNTECFSHRLLRTLVTFVLVSFAWIFFRANTITEAFSIIARIITKPTPWVLFNDGLYKLGLARPEMNILIVGVVILFLVDLIRVIKKQTLDSFLLTQNLWFEWAVVIGLIVMIFIFGEYGPQFDAKQFIYFQF
ncbi:MAG: MBOAT family O-acyltransferase [Eubacteriales bacterium]|nr:MBOAT family O-acyltransferase [Eubacteriales bacterium]